MANCPTCGHELECLHCLASKAGKTRAEMYTAKDFKTWGRMGGRPKKSAKKKSTAKKRKS